MKLTKYERKILINQFEIRKRLEATDQYDRLITILEEGYSYWYEEAVTGMCDDVSEDDCRFVRDVLLMFRMIEWYKQDSGDALEGELHTHFAGFDGNNEAELMGFAKFEIEGERQWDEQKRYAKITDGFNSHMPMRQIYERMLRVFNSLGSMRKLTRDDVMKVLAAARGNRLE